MGKVCTLSKLKNKETSPTRNSLLKEGFFFGRHINKTAEFMVPPCQALSCHSFQFFTPYKTDISLRRCLSPSRVISITRLIHSFKHFSFVILLFHFLMISLFLLDVGLSCFVCLLQVITDRSRAVEGKFFLSFHLPPHLPPPPPPPLLHLLLPQIPRFASYTNSLLLKIQSSPSSRKIKSIDCPSCVWFHWVYCE